jgi:hypothetical protein
MKRQSFFSPMGALDSEGVFILTVKASLELPDWNRAQMCCGNGQTPLYEQVANLLADKFVSGAPEAQQVGKTSAQQVVQLVGRWSCQSPTGSLVMLHNKLANLFA